MIGNSNTPLVLLACLGLSLGLTACGDDANQVTQQRGMGGVKPIVNSPAAGNGTRRSGTAANAGSGEAPAEAEQPRRPRAVLTHEDFSGRARDPFHNYLAAEALDAPAPVEIVNRQREVRLAQYTFDELRLIAIVNAGRSVAPRALFLAGDNKSKSVKQGEYFSSAEVLLASVNRDYIEIEVVDPELTPGWNLERGERKVIYLKDK